MALITPFLVFFCVAAFLSLLFRKTRQDKFLENFSGPMRFPVIGNFWYFAKLEERLTQLVRCQAVYGNRTALPAGPFKFFFLFHPNDVAKILSNRELNKSVFYDMLFSNWIGSSIFYAKGQEYFRKRKLLLPAFDFKHVDKFEDNCNKHSKKLVELLRSIAINDEVTDIHQLINFCALDIATNYTLGKSTESLSNFQNGYAKATHDELTYVSHRLVTPWLWADSLWKISKTGRNEKATRTFLQNFFDKFLQDRKKEILSPNGNDAGQIDGGESGGKEKMKLLDLLIREQQRGQPGLTDKYIREELNLITFAAHDTVASGMTFAIFLLAANPEEQAKVQFELDSVFGEDRSRDIQPSDLPNLKYLECCFKETLRLYPPAPVMFRSIEKDLQLDEKVTIPNGIQVVISPWVTHRIPEIFPEPEKFDPTRFMPENCIERHPYAFIPFSAGPRNCMGQKIAITKAKIILAHIFRNFTVELDSPAETMVPIGNMILYPKDGLKIRLKKR